jgi:hypothetical protein
MKTDTVDQGWLSSFVDWVDFNSSTITKISGISLAAFMALAGIGSIVGGSILCATGVGAPAGGPMVAAGVFFLIAAVGTGIFAIYLSR